MYPGSNQVNLDEYHVQGIEQMASPVSFDDLAEIIKEQLSGPLEEWEMPWHTGIEEPYNPVSNHVYSGNNAVTLINSAANNGFKSSQWASLRTWALKGVRVIAGSKATKIHIPISKRSRHNTKADKGDIQGFKTLNVFNADQIAGYDEKHPDMFEQTQYKGSIEDFIVDCKANIEFHNGDAFYRVHLDKIFLPFKQNFVKSRHAPAEHNFYATAIHELVHWSGHPDRLNRSTLSCSSHEQYALEELIAELGTAIICSRFENLIEPRTDHAAYLKSWLKGLDETSYFNNAFKQAQEAVHFLFQLTGLDIHPLSANGDNQLSNSGGESNETDSVTYYTDFKNLGATTQGFVRHLRIQTNCSTCGAQYCVTLMRYETVTICPDCNEGNKHKIVW